MGINGLGQLNQAELQKILAQRSGGARVQQSQQNINMTRNGSIFNMPRPDSTVTAQRSSHLPSASSNSVNNQQESQEFSVNDGKAAASSAESSAADAKSGTAQTEANTKEVNSIASDSKKLAKTTNNDVKAMQKTLKLTIPP